MNRPFEHCLKIALIGPLMLILLFFILLPLKSFASTPFFAEIADIAEIKDRHSSRYSPSFDQSPFIIMADTQTQNLLAPPHLLRSNVSDSFVEVSIRPPQLDLFARDLIEWVIREKAENKFIIHLGDALNIGCKNEWMRFSQSMNMKSKNGKLRHRGWVMAPGNHDFFYYGIAAGSRIAQNSYMLRNWKQSCADNYYLKKPKKLNDVALTKKDFILTYKKHLLNQATLNPKDFPIKNEDIVCEEKLAKKIFKLEPTTKLKICSFKSPDKNSFYQRLYYSYPVINDTRVYYKSLILQELNIGDQTKVVLLDTTDMLSSPTTILSNFNKKGNAKFLSGSISPGVFGSIGEEQINIIKSWYQDNHRQKNILLMGHHPLKSLTDQSRINFLQLKKYLTNATFISAHTHTGYVNHEDFIPELNVGSLIDYRAQTVQFQKIKSEIIGPLSFVREEINPSDIGDNNNACDQSFKSTGIYAPVTYKNVGSSAYRMFDYQHSLIDYHYKKMLDHLKLQSILFNQTIETITHEQMLAPYFKTLKESKCAWGNFGKKCRQEKLNLTLNWFLFDRQLRADRDIYDARIDYGACQALWSSKAEYDMLKAATKNKDVH